MSDQERSRHRGNQSECWLIGGGEMGDLVRAKDWSHTPLGPIESWPQSLRTTVSLCLASNFPISIAWGPQRVQIYNDGYWPICAAKHPRSMGQDFKECWLSAWPVIGDAFERASNGETCFLVNQRMFLDRLGYLEETFFTFSFSPIRDESGGIGGLFHPVTELTQQSLAERRLRVLRDLADRSATATSIDEGLAVIAHTLEASELDVPFALFYRLDSEGKSARRVALVGLQPGSALAPDRIHLDVSGEASWPLAKAQAAGESLMVGDLARRFEPFQCRPYDEAPHSGIVQPILLPGLTQPVGFLVTGVSSRRPLDEPYRTFHDMLGEAAGNALAKARAYEEERKRAEALAELDRVKTVFFSNVSHEFRTPLTLMLGPLEDALAHAHGILPPGAAQDLETSHRNALRLLKLVNTMLDFSRIEAGRIQASYHPTDLASLTAELASNFRSACEKASLRLVIDCPPLSEPVYVDRDMWEKIVLNLISNAFKFTLQGEIAVGLRAVDGHARLTVRDTGVGIPADELPRMFERFHRIEHHRGRTHEGTGIGLALVQELVKLHGGTVRVESLVNEGSTFTVVIPFGAAHLDRKRIGTASGLAPTGIGSSAFIEEAQRWLPSEENAELEVPSPESSESDHSALGAPQSASMNPRDEDSEPSKARPRVLVVEDNADMREYLRRLLNRNYDVEAVADGQVALQRIQADLPDLVLSDVMMPRLDGFGLLRALRDDPATKTIPVILLSARAGEESRVEGLGQGADDYLTKPFSARELLARVEAHIRLQRVRRGAEARLRSLAGRLESLVKERTQELEQSRERLRALATELNLAEQRERRRLATELHDHLQQMLVLGKLKLGQGKRLANVEPTAVKLIKETDEVLSDALTYTRTMVAELSPPVLREFGLSAGLKWLGEYMKKREHRVAVVVPDSGDLKLPDDQVILLFQSVRELLINSSKHAETSEAKVTMEQRDGNLFITVSDEGKGFDLAAAAPPPAEVPSGGLSSKYGLYSIQERMLALGGSFDIRSAPGQGTTAMLSLPLSGRADDARVTSADPPEVRPSVRLDEPARRAPKARQPVKRKGVKTVQVLLVDDHEMIRQGLRMVLESYNDVTIVGEAVNGEEALAAVEKLRPDVVIMDINMPRMNGIEATGRIKHRYPETAVIGLSVNMREADRQAMRQAGAVHLMTKESAVEQLYDAIQDAMKNREPAG